MHYVPIIQQDNAPCNSSLKKHTFTRDQGGDIFELPPYNVDLTPMYTDCSIVKRHVSWMTNIKDKIFENYSQIWCTLNSDDLEVMHSAMPKRIQAVITTNSGVT